MTFDKSELQELLEEATVDCYDEDEQFWGLFTVMDESLPFPFPATVVGEAVSVLDLDGKHSSMFGGIHARVRRGDKEYTASLTSLNAEKASAEVAKWLAVYGYWASLG